MEIPDETPQKPLPEKKKKAEASSPQPELDPKVEKIAQTVASAAAGVVHSRSKLNMLSFLLSECAEAEKTRSPADTIGRIHQEKNIAEKFLLDRSESPLQEAEEAKQYLQALNRPVKLIDESDPDNRTLADFLVQKSPEKMQEIQNAVEQILKEETILEKIREIVIQSSPELLEDYQEYQEVVGGLSQEQNLGIILGENAPEKEKEEFRSILQEEEKENQGWAMLEAEKARILCHALTLPGDSARKEAVMTEAKRLLGDDTVNLIQAQVNHTSKTILKLYAADQEPSRTAEEVLCPQILERMGEEGPNKQQLKALADVQDFYLYRRDGTAPSQEEITHQIARTALASLYVIEHGQWIGNTNTLKEYREVLQSKKKDFTEFLNERTEAPEEETEAPKAHKASNPIPGKESGEKETPGDPATPTDPKTKDGEKSKKTPYEARMDGIGKIIDTFNEGLSDEKQRVSKTVTLKKIEDFCGGDLKGLYGLKEDDIQKLAKPKMLATAIAAYLGKEKEKEAKKQGIKGAIKKYAGYHMTKLHQKMFTSAYKNIKEAILPQEGKLFGNNEGIVRGIKEAGLQAMDQVS